MGVNGAAMIQRTLMFFRVEWNGQRWYATCAEFGPYTSPEQAMLEADRLNAKQALTRKKENRAVIEDWKSRRTQ
jgi:hypothetical protein